MSPLFRSTHLLLRFNNIFRSYAPKLHIPICPLRKIFLSTDLVRSVKKIPSFLYGYSKFLRSYNEIPEKPNGNPELFGIILQKKPLRGREKSSHLNGYIIDILMKRTGTVKLLGEIQGLTNRSYLTSEKGHLLSLLPFSEQNQPPTLQLFTHRTKMRLLLSKLQVSKVISHSPSINACASCASISTTSVT